MVTVIKRSTQALDHYNLGEIDYPINTWHDREPHMFAASLTRYNCPLMFSLHIMQSLVCRRDSALDWTKTAFS